MNSKLPLEIIIQIFRYLHYEQKQQCKFVCRSWVNACRIGNSDTETLLFKRDPTDMTSLHNYFTIKPEKKSVIGESCKRIVCSNHHSIFYVAYNFPNLRVLCFFQDAAETVSYRNKVIVLSEYNTNLLKNWYRHLEILMIVECPLFIAILLKSGTFSQLKKLSVVLLSNAALNSLSLMINELPHAPQLQVLHLHNATINVADLEKIHRNAPRLVSLKLIEGRIFSDRELPNSIKPSMSMKRLEIYKCYGSFMEMGRVVPYIPKKYPCLQEFYNENCSMNFIPFGSIRSLVAAVSAAIVEKKLRSGIHNQQAIKPNEYATTEAITLADSLENLGIDMSFNSGTQTRELYESELFLNLKLLSLTNVPPISFCIFKEYHKLKTLELSFSRGNFFCIQFNNITRDLPPQLETLGLTFTRIYLDPKTAWTHSDIKWLKLESSEIMSNLANYLSIYFPKLNSLSVTHCSSSFGFGFHLPHHSFLFVDIISRRPLYFSIVEGRGGRKSSQYECLSGSHFEHLNTRSREDLFHRHDHAIYPVLKPSTRIFSQYPSFEFSCISVQTLLYNGCLIL